jgi:hypothetical protein
MHSNTFITFIKTTIYFDPCGPSSGSISLQTPKLMIQQRAVKVCFGPCKSQNVVNVNSEKMALIGLLLLLSVRRVSLVSCERHFNLYMAQNRL